MTRALSIAALLFAATALATPALADKRNNSVIFATEETLNSADPYFAGIPLAFTVADSIWDTLIFRDPATNEYRGNLATAWRWIDDKTLELDLRQGVKFHNGATFDADDVAYTFNFVAKPENKAIIIPQIRWIDHVEKLGQYKIRIVAREPFPAAVTYLASPFLVIHPHEYYAKVGPKGMSAKPVGTGPFRVVEFDPGKHLLLERNRDYFRDSPKSQPKLDKVEIRFVPDAQTRIAGMVAGGLDLIMYVAPDQADQMRAIPSLRIVSGETMRVNYMRIATTPNAPSLPLRDLKVRQAIAYAIDRAAMAKYIVGEGSRVLHAECYPRQFGCIDEGIPRYNYNPAKARALLAEAGYANGFAVDLYAYRDRNQVEAIVGYLNAVGIRARLRFMQFAAIMTAQRNGRTPLYIDSNASAGIMDAGYLTTRNHEFSPDDVNKDAEVRDLLVKADSTMDPEARKAAYANALKLIAERVYSLPLYSIPNYYPRREGPRDEFLRGRSPALLGDVLQMKRAPYVIGITSLLLAACSTTNVENTYELSSKSGNGVIVGSITSSGALADYRIYYRKIGSSGDGSFVLASSDPSLNAKLIVAELPAGDYEVFRWLVTINGGNLKLEVSPRVGFSIPFHVAPGEAVYIGSCNFAFTMRDGVANVAATSVACTDESARDLQELAVRYPRLASMTAGLHAARAELYRDNRFSARRVGPPEPPGLPGAE